jgi:hypothetical protein
MKKKNILLFLILLFSVAGVSGANNSEPENTPENVPQTRKRAVYADFDGDGKTDLSVFRWYEGDWHIRRSSDNAHQVSHFGKSGDVFVPGDFDGDGKADFAIFRRMEHGTPEVIVWYIFNSSDSTISYRYFGLPNDTPVVGDYDGDGKTDIAVYRTYFESYNTWYVSRSSDGVVYQITFRGNTLLPADYDGDGKTDIAVYQRSIGKLYVLKSSDFSVKTYQWRSVGGNDQLSAGDYDGDGLADLAIFHTDIKDQTYSTWYILKSRDGDSVEYFGNSENSHPIRGDFDGDGKFDIGYYDLQTGFWDIKHSSDNSVHVEHFGMEADDPVPVFWFSS